MDFTYNENQQMLFDAADRFLTDRHDLPQRKALLTDRAGQDRFWNDIAEMGWIGAAFPEELGGFATSPVDAMVLLERMGRHLVTAPFLATAIVCGRLLIAGLAGSRRDDLIARVVAGKCRMALVAGGSHALHSPQHHSFTASAQGAGFVLNGRAPVVMGADSADVLLVAARTGGAHGDLSGLTLFAVDATAPGVTRRPFRMIDGFGAAELVIENLAVGAEAIIGVADQAVDLVNLALDHGIAGLCGEALGSMAHLVPATAEYTRTREQYGAPLAKFQVLQHRMADMYIQTETARSMTYVASLSLDDADARRQRIISAAKVQVGRSGTFVGSYAVQLHGGLGVAEELDSGHHYMRLTTINQLFGNAGFHLRRFADLGRRPGAEPL